MLDLSSVDLDGIAAALADKTDYEHWWLIDPETGEIVSWTSDTGIDGQTQVDLDELDLVCIHPLPSWIWYQDMADFAEGITNERAGRTLLRAIQGKGAFRHFRTELQEEHPGLLSAWYAFRDARAQRRAVGWLADNELIDDGAAERFLADHPVRPCREACLPQVTRPAAAPALPGLLRRRRRSSYGWPPRTPG